MARTACLLLLLVAVASTELDFPPLKCVKASEGVLEWGSVEILPIIIPESEGPIIEVPIPYRRCVTSGVEVEVCRIPIDRIVIEKVSLKEVLLVRPLIWAPRYPVYVNITIHCLGYLDTTKTLALDLK